MVTNFTNNIWLSNFLCENQLIILQQFESYAIMIG